LNKICYRVFIYLSNIENLNNSFISSNLKKDVYLNATSFSTIMTRASYCLNEVTLRKRNCAVNRTCNVWHALLTINDYILLSYMQLHIKIQKILSRKSYHKFFTSFGMKIFTGDETGLVKCKQLNYIFTWIIYQLIHFLFSNYHFKKIKRQCFLAYCQNMGKNRSK